MDIMFGIFSETFWWIAPILVSLTTALTGVIVQGFKIEKGRIKQLISWVVGSGITCAAWGLKFITFGQPIWLGVICLCIVVSLASNGIYDITYIKSFINTWFNKKPTNDFLTVGFSSAVEVTTSVTIPPVLEEPIGTTEPVTEPVITPKVTDDMIITTPEVITTTTPEVTTTTTPEVMMTTTTPEVEVTTTTPYIQ